MSCSINRSMNCPMILLFLLLLLFLSSPVSSSKLQQAAAQQAAAQQASDAVHFIHRPILQTLQSHLLPYKHYASSPPTQYLLLNSSSRPLVSFITFYCKTFKLSDGRSDSPIEYILNSDFTPAKPSIPLNRSKKLNELVDCLSSELEKNEIRNVRRRKRKRNCIEHKPFTVRFEGNFWERRKERTFFINGMRRKGWGIYF